MRPAEKAKGKPGKPRPAGSRVHWAKASARKLHQRMRPKKNPSTGRWARRGVGRFSGASSVASALAVRPGATPRGPFHPNTYPAALLRKADISTLLALGHFYFALTIPEAVTIRASTFQTPTPLDWHAGCTRNGRGAILICQMMSFVKFRATPRGPIRV